MIRSGLSLIVAAVALPAISFAAAPTAPTTVMNPVVVAPMPPIIPMMMPVAFIRQMALMQQQMAMLQRIAFSRPLLTSSFGFGGLGNGAMQVSMLSFGGPGGVCSEQMQVVPGPNGQTKVYVRRSGNACTPMSTAFGKAGGMKMTPMPAAPTLPGNALPPPSKLIYADYPVPVTASPAQQG